MIQTAEGALNETHSILQRMRELATQAANDTNVTVDRDAIQDEMDELAQEINRIADTTQFNTQDLLKGTFTGKQLQIGANENQNLTIGIRDMSATGTILNVGTASVANASVSEVSVVAETNAVLGTDAAARVGSIVATSTISRDLDIKFEITSAGATDAKAVASVTINGKTVTGIQADADGENGVFTLDASKFGDTFGASQSVVLNAGAAWSAGDEYNIKITGQRTTATGPDVSSYANAKGGITAIDNAIKEVSSERSKLGAWQNRLEHTINNLGTSSENLTAAESRIRDVDMAKEMMDQTKNSILAQAAQAMLAQANQQPQGVLQLLR